ncbi:MAG: acyl carrier protein [Planctomycetes bacterium]|nr:acyl carrier protein [Planctomycetota bacterium]
MVDSNVLERTRKVVADLLKLPEAKVTDDAHMVQELGMVSIQSVELIAALEEEFDIEIDQDEVADIFTVKEAAEWVEGVLGA